MNTIIQNRLTSLRAAMEEQNLAACFIPTADYHLSEYVGDHFKFRSWLSGFTGSAGTLVVLADEAGLWTDGRYFLQAEAQLAGTGIQLYKMQLPGVPSIQEFLCSRLKAGDRVGVDGRTLSTAAGQELSLCLSKKQITLDASQDLAAQVWHDRPALAAGKIWLYPQKYAGRSSAEKLQAVRAQMKKENTDVHILCALDEIAWIFNLRGSDVNFNPVFLAYAVIEQKCVYLFLDREKLEPEAQAHLRALGVELLPYNSIYDFMSRYDNRCRVLISKDRLNYRLFSLLEKSGVHFVFARDPAVGLKAVKSDTEIDQTRKAHIRDGVIMVRFMKWLKEQPKDGSLTEASAAAYLDALRRDAKGNLGLSFETISGYGPHGAIVHYAVTEETDIPLEPHGLFLVDSGGHYLDGTTDITRTFALGPLTTEEKEHFALVLRCMLNLMYAVFPTGVCCHNLDALARNSLWQAGLNYLHGTGHGVGHVLNVHEGPNNFHWKLSPSTVPVELVPGMITTDEPGVYISGKHGIRLENELLCRESHKNEFGDFLEFESLTLAPIDLDAVEPSLLGDRERAQLNAYHKRVYELLSPELTPDEKVWLAEYTREI